jgi:putative ATP-dependent endonuclease of the OLD family
MKLRKIRIQNFRGIKDLELDLDDLVVLIGENNTGKTAILHALKLCLRDLGPRKRVVFDPFDFHLRDGTAEPSTAAPISITLTFGETSSEEWDAARLRRLRDIVQVDANSGLNSVILRVTCSYNVLERDFDQNWDFLNTVGTALPGKTESALSSLQREVTFYLLDALRDAGRNFDAKGPFWRPFLKDGQLPADKKAEIEAKLNEVNELVVSSHGTFDKARTRLKKVQEVVPMQAGDVVSIEAVPGRIFDMLAKAQVHLGTTTGAKVPVGRHGEGTQSLAVLMLFAAFLDLNAEGAGKDRAPLVAFEEPEAHLHPSAVRTLWQMLDSVPGQKLVSTHSGDLLSQVPIDAVRRLARSANGVEVFRLKHGTLDTDAQRMFDFHIRRARGELLFARCWLLGEGETEITLFHEIARHLKIDLERAGVRCVPHRLGASVELFLKVAKDFGIRCCVLTDNDQQGKADQKHVKNNFHPSELPDVLHVMPEGDIEHYLCNAGFGSVYQAVYDGHPQLHSPPPPAAQCPSCGKAQKSRPSVTAAVGDPEYWPQILKVAKNVLDKPGLALRVIEEIRGGHVPVPSLLETAIRSAVTLAGGV